MARAGISRLDSLLQRAATGTLISELYSRCIRLSWNIGAGYSEAQKSRFVLPVVTLESYSAFRSDTAPKEASLQCGRKKRQNRVSSYGV